MREAIALVILLVLLSPGAAAAPVTTPSLDLPTGITLEGEPLAVYVNDTTGVTALRLHARVVHVDYTNRSVEEALTARVELGTQHATYDLHDVTLDLAPGSTAGWLALYPADGSTAELIANRGRVVARQDSTIGSSPVTEQAPDPSRYQSSQHVSGPHVVWTGQGLLSYRGDGALKLHGTVQVLTARENTSRLDTTSPTGLGTQRVHERSERWALLTFEDATLVLGAQSRIQVAAPRLSTAKLVGLLGDGTRVALTNTEILPTAEDGIVLMPETSASLAAVRATPPPPVFSGWTLAGSMLGALLVLASAAVLAVLWWHHKQNARGIPTHQDLSLRRMSDQLAAAGSIEEALQGYEQAAIRGDHEALMWAGLLALEDNRDAQAEEYLLRAINAKQDLRALVLRGTRHDLARLPRLLRALEPA